MKKIFKFILPAIACIATACHKDTPVTYLQPVVFNANFVASTDSVGLSPANDSLPVLSFTWAKAVYPVTLSVTYTIQVDVPSDTIGESAWGNATGVVVGNDVYGKTFKGAELNTLALAIGMTPNAPGTLVFRVQAYQDRNAFSSAIAVIVSPYETIIASHGWPIMYAPGFFEGWSPATAPTVAAEQTGIYEGFIYMPTSTDPSAYHFKFTNAPDWNHLIEGDGGGGTLLINSNPPDMVLGGPGYYEVVCNTNALTWTATLVTWSIIGDATPGGWTSDTEMTFDPVKQVWTVTANMLSTGSYKFRANNAWNIDFGVDANNQLAYADNPAYPYNGSLNDLIVPVTGNYTITLNLNDPNNYTYTLQRN
jgi:hypothetical protein